MIQVIRRPRMAHAKSMARAGRFRPVGFLLAGLVLVASACGTSTKPSGVSAGLHGSPVTFGVITGETGPYTFIGKTFVTGATAAAKVINRAGGVLGRPVKIVSMNDSFDPVDALLDVKQMVAVDHVSVVLGLAAPDWPDAFPYLMSAHMVNFSRIAVPSFANKRYEYEFHTMPLDSVTGTGMAYYASLKHYSKIAVVLDSSEGAQTLKTPILTTAKKLHLAIVADVTLPATAGTLVAQVRQVIDSHPDAILFQESTTSGAGLFLSELQQQGGGNIPIVGSDLTAAASYVKAAGAAYYAREVVSIVAALPSNNAGTTVFDSTYEKLYHKPPENAAPSMYDGAIAAALAMDAAHSTNPTRYVHFVRKVTTPGPGITTVYTYSKGYKLLKEHKRIKYYGVSGPFTFSRYHTVVAPYEAVKTTASGTETVLLRLPGTELNKLDG